MAIPFQVTILQEAFYQEIVSDDWVISPHVVNLHRSQ